MNTSHIRPEGPLSVSGAPNLPAGFTDTFASHYVDAGDVRLHAVIGGDGPPLLLVHGWPETWYAWRLLMPALAQDFQVIAVDQRGRGLSDMPAGGYDTGTLANDLVALMDALGHERFAVVGHDTGFAISYALAADHPERVERVALAEIPGSPGAAPAPPVFVPSPINDRLWHLPFNRLQKINEQLVAGREDIFFGWEFDAAAKKLPDEVIAYYVGQLTDPAALSASFEWYRALDETIAQDGAAQDAAADHARAGDRRRVQLRRPRRGRDEARRGRRARRRHRRRRPLRRRGGPGRDARGADRLPRSVPRSGDIAIASA